jgi:hypothetical protein
MQQGLRIGLGIAVGAAAAGGVALALRRSPDPAYPEDRNGPGDAPISMPVRGEINPSGWFDAYEFDGDLRGSRLDATIDPRGWGNDIRVTGQVDWAGWDVSVDPRGWANDTRVIGARDAGGFAGVVDRPGIWNDVQHRITETVRGARVLREGRFDERLTPGFAEASWSSKPVGTGGGSRELMFDPPGWANNTLVTLEGNPPAGVEASIAAHLFDAWKTEQEREANAPDPDHPDTDYPTAPGYPNGPGDSYGPSW